MLAGTLTLLRLYSGIDNIIFLLVVQNFLRRNETTHGVAGGGV